MRCILRVFIWAAVVAIPAVAQLDPCISAVEAVSAAREITPNTPALELEQMLQYLEVGSDNCFSQPKVANAWYYRGLLEQKLGRPPKFSAYSLKKAQQFGSDAFANRLDPFSVASATEVADLSDTVREKWALIVGVGSFADTRIPSLQFTSKDAQEFAATLKDPGVGRFNPDHVRVLVDADATLSNIRRGLGWIRENAQPDDLVVLYLSSHGSPRELRPNGVSYVLTHDSDLSDGAAVYATSLSMSDIVDTLNKDLLARRIAVFLDTCYSGAAAPGVEPPGSRSFTLSGSGAETVNGVFTRIKGGVGWSVVAASRGDQQSWESDELQNGYFTYYLVESLRQAAGNLSMEDLFSGLKSKVSQQVLKDKGRDQTPVISTGGKGSKIVLGVAAGGT